MALPKGSVYVLVALFIFPNTCSGILVIIGRNDRNSSGEIEIIFKIKALKYSGKSCNLAVVQWLSCWFGAQ